MGVTEGGIDDARVRADRQLRRRENETLAKFGLDPIVGPTLQVCESVTIIRRAYVGERV